MVRSPRAFSQLSLANDNRARLLQPRNNGRGVPRLEPRRKEPASPRRRTGHRAQVLHRQRDTMQRSQFSAACLAGISRLRFVQGLVSAQMREGVKARLQTPNALDRVACDLLR